MNANVMFLIGLMPPFLSVKKVPGAMPSLELFWQFPYPTYVDYVTIYRSRDNAPATELTWMRVDDVRTTGQFTFVTSGLGSMYSVAVKVNSGADAVWSNFDSVVLPPPHPQQIRVASVTPELLTVHWPHDTTSCRGNCSYLVRYQQTSPYRYNSYPIRELHITCPNLLPAQPARSTNPSAISTCTAYFRDLIPGALYDIDVYASSYNVLSVTAAQLRQRIPPTPPVNVTVTNVTEQSITITWLPGPGFRTRYHLHAFAPSYNEEVGQVHGDVTEFTFHNLLAGTRYIISIRASANSTEGEMVLVGETTSPTRPGPVDRLRLEPQIDHRRIRLSFMSPMWHNGVLEGYQVEYIGHRSGNRTCNRGEKYLPVAETSVIIEGLKGGCNYTFTVKARNEVGLGAGVSDWILTAVTIPQVPDTRPPPPPSKTIKSRNFVVNFDPSMFDDVNGEITHIIVIVAESSAANEPTQSNSTPPRMLTWAEAISNDVIPPYQISEPIDLSDLAQGTRRKRSVADPTQTAPTTTQISIGTEECSYDNKDVYCNGPLIHGRSYVYRFRGISPGGYADTRNSLPVSLPVSPHGVIIGISTALFSLLVIVIILSIVVIVRKFRVQKCLRVVLQCKHRLDGRGRYLPANMKDVELTRVANNTHTISKQKHSRPVRVSDFTRDWFNMNADSNYGYSQEYEAIRKVGRKMTTNTAVSPANVGKNRYTNILPYDRTRVKLSPVDDEEGSDYVNANYIPGFSSPREYIACQGPLPGTSDDMWRMIWEQNVTTVVMVTQLVEKGKVKCDQYWPDDHMPVLYGDIQVTMNQTIEENDWNIKEFAVQQRDQRRYVRHWNFLSWPDHGVPESSQALLAFIRKIRGTKPPSSAPIAVHCSAGVGRTGTFIVLDHMLQHMEQYDFVDVMGVVCGMRMHRNFMVQTEQQYVFIHRCLMDVIEERGLAPVPLMSGSLP
nr:tyrosine-protein phosphatase 10D-like isoform X1 [Lytechinus pictus]